MFLRRGAYREDSYCKTADADQLVAVVGDADLPDVRGLTKVDGPGNTGNKPLPDATQVIGIDLQTHGIVCEAVYDKGGGYATQGFGERNGRSAMQEAIGLSGAVIHRHAAF